MGFFSTYDAADVLQVTDVRKVAPGLDRERRLWREKRRLSNEWFFGITRVTDVLSVFTFTIWNVFTHSISSFSKIFVAEGDSTYIFFTQFSYEHFIFQIYSPSLKCRRVLFDSEETILFAVSVTTNEISLLFIFKVDCAKCPRLTRKRFQDIHNQPDVQKHTVMTFLFKLYISHCKQNNNSCSQNYRPLKATKR